MQMDTKETDIKQKRFLNKESYKRQRSYNIMLKEANKKT